MTCALYLHAAACKVFLLFRGFLASKQENLLALQARAHQANEELHDNTLHLNSVEQNIKQMETLLLVSLHSKSPCILDRLSVLPSQAACGITATETHSCH